MIDGPTGWVPVSLSDVGVLFCGQSPTAADVNTEGRGTTYVTGPEQWNGHTVHRNKWTVDPRRTVPNGCIFITVKGAGVGKLFPGIPCAIGRDIYAYLPGDAIDRHFALLALKYNINNVIAQARGTIPGLSKEHILDQVVGCPPLAEQRRIVAKLDALTARTARARADLDRIPALAARYKQAVLDAAFQGRLTEGWRKDRRLTMDQWSSRTVAELATVVTGMTPPAAERVESFGGDIPFFKPTELDQGYDVRTARENLTHSGAAFSRLVPAMSTLVTCIGATIGKAGLSRVSCCMNQQINALTTRGKALPEWLYWVTISEGFQNQILENASATTLPIINKGRFERLTMPIAPVDEQQEIVRRIEMAFAEIDRLTAEATSAQRLLARLDQAILAKAFRGELVPQDPNDEPASELLARIKADRQDAPKARRGRKAKVS